jgi:NAD(P)H-nitrite reductase large subunit
MADQIYTENVLDAPDSEIVCWCSHVTKRTILAAKRQGATTLEAIRLATKACTLGRCKEFNPRGRCCSKEIKLLLEAAINDKECSP